MALSPERSGRITGSVIGAILGLSPFAKQKDVLRTMVRTYHGAESEFTGNVATEYGNFHEEYAIADFELETGCKVTDCGDNERFYIHPKHDWLGATPDGRIRYPGGDELIEIKCPYSKRKDDQPVFKSAEEQPHYLAQMQYEMLCSGLKVVNFYQWSSNGSRLERVEFDQEFINKTLPILKEFHDLYLTEIDNPEHLEPLIVEIPDTLAAEEYLLAKADMEAAKEKMEAAKAQLIKLANGKKSKIGGLLVFQTEKKGAISYAKVVKEHCKDVDLEPYRGKPSSFWSVK